MKTQSVEVIVQPDGKLQIEAVGFTGADCEKATRFLEAALGGTKERRRKPEYHRANTAKAKLRQQLGGGNS